MTVNTPQFVELASNKEDIPSYFPYIRRVVVLSPHFDDAILSMGSLIKSFLEEGVQVDVINVFTCGSDISTPTTRRLLKQAGFDNSYDYFETRREEDLRAFQLLGNVRLNYFNYVDAPWRGENGRAHYPDGHFDRTNKDTFLVHNLATTLASYSRIGYYDILFAPLGVGRHIDHLIVREAASMVGQRIMYYADFPYITCSKLEHDYIQSRQLVDFNWYGDYQTKAKSILAYKTQYNCLFGNQSMNLTIEKFFSPEKMIF